MRTRILIRAWLGLLGLSLLGTALSTGSAGLMPAWVAAIAILILAWAKARLILLCYLGLAGVPGWRGGAMAALGVAMLILTGLWGAGYLAAL